MAVPLSRLRGWITRMFGPQEPGRAPAPAPERADLESVPEGSTADDLVVPAETGSTAPTAGADVIVDSPANEVEATDTTGPAADAGAPPAVAPGGAPPLSPAYDPVATPGYTAGEVPLARSGTVGMQVAVEHRTTYRYDRPVQLGPQVIRLRPAAHCRTPILSYSLHVGGGEHFINWQQDPVGNHIARLVFPEPVLEFTVTVDLVADMTVINPFDFFVEESAKEFPFVYDAQLEKELAPYLETRGGPGPLLAGWLAEHTPQGLNTLDTLVELNRRVAGAVGYSVRMEPGVQDPEVTLDREIGSCRDSAWLLVHALRNLGIAARFASGYLVQLAPDRQPLEGPPGPTSDFTDLHAWAEAYLPGAGWVGLDATSGLLTGEGHIPLACTAEPASAAPIAGSIEAHEDLHTEFDFANVVTRIHEPPRVTKPYSDEQWERVLDLGRAVDLRLRANDVRLTMGGEPTFVSATDMESAEWNTDADGPTKYGLATALAGRLADRFASGALLRHAQGKWYPGEPLPRWAIGVHWRTDGEPLWNDPALLADPSIPGTASTADAAALAEAIASGLGIDAERLQPAYEDRLDQLMREARLPGGNPPEITDPEEDDARLRDAVGRAALTAELDAAAGQGEPTGWALPLHRADGEDRWRSGRWTLRRGRLILLPGDSPMGFRLPLESLTWLMPLPDPEPSRFASRPPLPSTGPEAGAADPVVQTLLTPPPALLTDGAPPITALCVEVRDGHPRVFLPPVPSADHAVELIGIVEQAAAKVGVPIVIEGYPPPGDDRLRSLSVTPDPGVIEVNIHPSETWDELTERTDGLDDDARRLGLATEKFEIDGLHSGTGGGSHVTLGGRTPADSPFLRRPDLLRSMVTYWQHHPSLSYLFSGRFIGPTSQAPRVDEARHENLYELEIAFSEMDRLSKLGPPPAWQVDRLLRNLLTDLTGNTHRAEFCIDKLYDPGSESGRLGIVELRGFEMPPHPQMSLVQGLLVRALIARLWSDPYAHDLVRWGTELHDKFLLPWWVEHDVRDVVGDLRRSGIRFEAEWLEPFLAFRFPLLGETVVDGVRMELRMAVEPWHVLGEESSGTGTSRYVDSSVERLQLRVDEYVEGRHVVLCEGRPVPMQPTGTPGTYVAGVRYRAWQPWSALHPTIGVHSPLVFDLVDRWSGRSLGGCTYHVVHPGGRSYDTFPVNASEAEARRSGRFEAAGHTPGPIEIPQMRDRSGEYPRTLDLRRAPRA
ncbi:MAG: transglutaminase family protein [Solirubrobacteraceae bacterium]|nr:transglutaminase family protein [Solirubrobacteraceae bacterium]